jgi:hypothetical protein
MKLGEKIYREAAKVTGKSDRALKAMAQLAFCSMLHHALRKRGSIIVTMCRITDDGRLDLEVDCGDYLSRKPKLGRRG